MTLETMLKKPERMFASMGHEELYLFRGLLLHDNGRALLIEMIDKKIIYLENLPRIAERN